MIFSNNRLILPILLLLIPSILSESTNNELKNNPNNNGLICKFNTLPPRESIHAFNLVNIEPHTNTFTFGGTSDDDTHKLNKLGGDCERTEGIVRLRKRQQYNNQKGGIYDPFFNGYTSYDSLKSTLASWSNSSLGWASFIPVYGRSAEGRDLFAVHITNPKVQQNKTFIWINAGLDGSSTLAPSTAAYMIRALLYDSYYPDVAELMQKYAFAFTPMANPDGFEYSRLNKIAWKKNRSRQQGGNFGVDLTRNFDDHWCAYGGSTNPNTNNYCGTRPMSEPESYYLVEYAKKISGGLWAALDLYTGGQVISRSPGWSYTYTMNNAIEKGITDGMAVALGEGGYQYRSVVASEAFGLNSGSLMDFMNLQAKIPTFGLYLSPATRSGQVAASEILKASDAAYSSLLQMARYMYQLPMNSNQMKPQGALTLNPGQIVNLLGQGITNIFGGGRV